jgi:hypothetical protein
VSYLLLASLPIWFITIFNFSYLRKDREAEIKQQLSSITRIVAVKNEQYLLDTKTILSLVSQLKVIQDNIIYPKNCNAFFAQLLKNRSQYLNFAVVDLDGRIVCDGLSTPAGNNVLFRPYIQRAVQTKTFSVGGYQTSITTGKPSLNMAYPVLDEENTIQYILVGVLDLSWLDEYASKIVLPNDFKTLLVDNEGSILSMYPNDPNYLRENDKVVPFIQTVLNGYKQGDVFGKAVGLDGNKMYYSSLLIEIDEEVGDIYVIVGINENVAFGDLLITYNRGIGMALAVTILTLVISMFGLRCCRLCYPPKDEK